ncbi:MAG: hypothetical protein V4675_09960 [Verrucomicrobiota bacterium]
MHKYLPCFLLLLLLVASPAVGQVNWAVRASTSTEHIRAVAYGAGAFVAVDGRPLRSTDGATWTRPQWTGSGEMLHVFYVGNRFLALGDNYYWVSNQDGTAATRFFVNYLQPGGETDAAVVNGVVLVTGTYLSTGSALLRMDAGSNVLAEVNSFPSTDTIYWVVSTGTEFLASAGGAIYASSDGLGWVLRHPGHVDEPLFHGGFLFASGKVSTDGGATWPLNTAQNAPLLYGGGYFLRLSFGQPLTSVDGITWTERESGTTDDLSSVAFGNNTFVAVGYGGRITTSSAVTPSPALAVPALTVVPSVTIKWASQSGRWYEVETSPNMTTWTKTEDLIPGSGQEMTRSFDQTGAQKFFRVAAR